MDPPSYSPVQVPGAFEVADCDLKDALLFAHELGAGTVACALAVISSGAAVGRLTPNQTTSIISNERRRLLSDLTPGDLSERRLDAGQRVWFAAILGAAVTIALRLATIRYRAK
jgi:hypothetical protein